MTDALESQPDQHLRNGSKLVKRGNEYTQGINMLVRERAIRKTQKALVDGLADVITGGSSLKLKDVLRQGMKAAQEHSGVSTSGIFGQSLAQFQGLGIVAEWKYQQVPVLKKSILSMSSDETDVKNVSLAVCAAIPGEHPSVIQGTFTFNAKPTDLSIISRQLNTRISQLSSEIS